MSIELEVRLGSKTVAMSALVKAIADELEVGFSGHDGRRLTWDISEGSPAVLGVGSSVGRLAVSDVALVEVRSYSIGTEEEFAEDGGWWVSFSAVVRSPETKVLMLIAAACLARMVPTQVLDDALLMKQERWLLPESILAIVGTGGDLSLAQAAATLKAFGKLPFGIE